MLYIYIFFLVAVGCLKTKSVIYANLYPYSCYIPLHLYKSSLRHPIRVCRYGCVAHDKKKRDDDKITNSSAQLHTCEMNICVSVCVCVKLGEQTVLNVLLWFIFLGVFGLVSSPNFEKWRRLRNEMNKRKWEWGRWYGGGAWWGNLCEMIMFFIKSFVLFFFSLFRPRVQIAPTSATATAKVS